VTLVVASSACINAGWWNLGPGGRAGGNGDGERACDFGSKVWGRLERYKNAVTAGLWIAASVGMYEVLEEMMLEGAVRGWVGLKSRGCLMRRG
jgi:hypothetical protein